MDALKVTYAGKAIQERKGPKIICHTDFPLPQKSVFFQNQSPLEGGGGMLFCYQVLQCDWRLQNQSMQ